MYQWYLFVLLAGISVFADLTRQTFTVTVCGRRERRYGWLPVLVLLIPLICQAAARTDAFGDTYTYMRQFASLPASLVAIPDALTAGGKDRGFTVFSILVKSLLTRNVRIYFAIIAAICLFPLAGIYRKHSCNFIMSMFLFLASADYVQWTHNGIRQFIAVSVAFGATGMLLQKKYLRYYALIVLMSTIHASALIMIPVSLAVQGRPWNRWMVCFILAVLAAVPFSSQLRSLIAGLMAQTQYRGEVSQFLNTGGTSLLRVLVFCIPPILALVFRQQLLRAQDPMLNLTANMSVASMGFYILSAITSGIFVGRIPVYFSLYNYILLPWLVEHVFERRSRLLVYGAIIICYLAFYYYQITVTWNL